MSSDTIPPEAAALPPERRFGDYIAVERLGQGGMGEVWKAWDVPIGRWVALKLLRPWGREEGGPSEIERFLREARAAGGLSHPGIAAVYAAGEANGRHYIAMQYVDGRTLRALSPMEPRQAAAVVRDAAIAVHAAHARRIVHRDLKPENLMFVPLRAEGPPDADESTRVQGSSVQAGRVYVMDFGLARSTATDTRLSQSGTAIGTPAYMAPEQAQGRHDAIDARTDVYGLGATLHELLTGTPPFTGDAYTVLMHVVERDPPRLREVDADLEAIVLKCMEKAPERRYASAMALAEDLRRWLDGEPITARRMSAGRRFQRWLSRRRWVVPVAALVLLAVLAGIAVRLARRAQAEEWVRDAQRLAAESHYAEALTLLERARTRLVTDEDLERRCRDAIEEQRMLAAAKELEDHVLGPLRAKLRALADTEEGWRRGVSLVEEALVRIPRSWELLMLRGELTEKLGDADEAMRCYDQALELNPALGMAHYRRGVLLMDWRRDFAGAQKAFEAAERVDPDNELAVVGRARLALLADDPATALRLVDGLGERGHHVVDAHFIRASVHNDLRSGLFDPEKSQDAYGEVIRREPWAAVAWFNRSNVRDLLAAEHESSGRRAEADALRRRALEDIEQAMRLGLDPPRVYANRGQLRDAVGEPGAEQDLDRAVAEGPEDAITWFYRGLVRNRHRDFSRAADDFRRAATVDPKMVEAYAGLAQACLGAGDVPGSLQAASEALRRDDRHASSWLIRGRAKLALGDVDGALADFESAVRLARSPAAALAESAIALGRAGRHEEAEAACARALESNPRHVEALLQRSSLRLRRGDLEGAEGDAEAAVREEPGGVRPLAARAEARRRRKNFEGAIADAERIVELSPRHDGAWTNLGRIRLESGDASGALAAFERAVDLDPKEATHRYNQGNALRAMDRDAEAVDAYTKAIDLRPDYASAWNNRGNARRKLGDAAGARADLDRSIELDADNPNPWYNRALLRASQGDFAGAREDLRRVIALTPDDSPLRLTARQRLEDWSRGDQ